MDTYAHELPQVLVAIQQVANRKSPFRAKDANAELAAIGITGRRRGGLFRLLVADGYLNRQGEHDHYTYVQTVEFYAALEARVSLHSLPARAVPQLPASVIMSHVNTVIPKMEEGFKYNEALIARLEAVIAPVVEEISQLRKENEAIEAALQTYRNT